MYKHKAFGPAIILSDTHDLAPGMHPHKQTNTGTDMHGCTIITAERKAPLLTCLPLAEAVRDVEVRRALVLVSKVLQLLGNGQTQASVKEGWMATATPYLQRVMPAVIAFIDRLSVCIQAHGDGAKGT